MQPRSEGVQRRLSFSLQTDQPAAIMPYLDAQGNGVQYFDIPNRHSALTITAQAVVELTEPPVLPARLDPDAWTLLDTLTAHDAYWDYLQPSRYARPTPLLLDLLRQLDLDTREIQRRSDPLHLVHAVNTAIHHRFTYKTRSTTARSPIDETLQQGTGVCQDFAHIMIALLREVGIPARYVSGYLAQRGADADRSPGDATHAWIEALLPGLGWAGFDPTNDLVAGDRHVRVAIGRDYADVPPTHGVFTGGAETELTVEVQVTPSPVPHGSGDTWPLAQWTSPEARRVP